MKTFVTVLLALLAGQVWADETFAEKMVLATYKLYNEKSTAAGFVVEAEDGRHFVVSSEHVFRKMQGETAILVLRKKMKNGTYERYDQKIPVRKRNRALWVKHRDQDVAVLEIDLDLPENVELRSVPAAALASEEAAQKNGLGVGAEVLICGYPTRFEVNGAGFPVTRRGSVASFPLVPVAKHPTMVIDFSTFEGDSGGPVFLKRKDSEDPLVVGVVVSQFRHTENIDSFVGKQTINHPLWLSTVVQARSIVETLEAARNEEDAK